jgi:hypothetical protein
LSKKFKVSGIPTLVLLDGSSGKVITADGRSIVTDDKEGKSFPWTPRKFVDIIPGVLERNQDEKCNWSDIQADVIGLYFSAHWVSMQCHESGVPPSTLKCVLSAYLFARTIRRNCFYQLSISR